MTRLRAEHGAAAGPDRRARRAGTGAAGALLAPRLGATAGDLAPRLGRVRALPASVELGADRLVDERHVEAGLERDRVQGGGAAAGLGGGLRHRFGPPRWSRSGPAPRRGRAAGSGWP